MKRFEIKKMIIASMFIALGLLMPFLTGQIPSLGSKLLPMHIPVLLCGFIIGWPYGLTVGFIVPIFRSMIFGMPPMFPVAIAMAFELAVYGFMAGFLYKRLPKKNAYIWVSLVLSMLAGRIVWGAVSFVLFSLSGASFTWQIFAAGAFINAIPGIIIQLILIPVILVALKKAKVLGQE